MSGQAEFSEPHHDFACSGARRPMDQKEEDLHARPPLTNLWLGIASAKLDDGTVKIGFACHDGTYTMDFAVDILSSGLESHSIADYTIDRISSYAKQNAYRYLGAGITEQLLELCPSLMPRLWAELDIVPVITKAESGSDNVDEVADSMARKCVMVFAPDGQLRLDIGLHNNVRVDLGGRTAFATLQQYMDGVGQETKRLSETYANMVKERNKSIAFFSATPRGGGVALMRHALLRYFDLLGVDCSWRVPNPKPAVFRVTKTNHNILQGVAKPHERFTTDSQKLVDAWGTDNAERFWTKDGCPLAPRSKGGADVIVVDDPQMPVLVSIAKRLDPDRPVIYRSHIQVRSDIVGHADSQAHAVWAWIWSHVQKADVFVAHPISKFVPAEVPRERVAYMPATTDWIDGLNKKLSDESTRGYLDDFNLLCLQQHSPPLVYPKRDYVVQVARFDPSKGFDDCLAAYAYFRYNSPFCKGKPSNQTPQLLLCGHSSVDDPDGSIIFKDILDSLDNDYSDLKDSVVVMRVGPSDQMLNTLLSCAHVALQLSTSEGFEVKVSEALHKGIPVIARNVGGLPLQVQHGKNGFLIQGEDRDAEIQAVAEHLQTLFTDTQKHAEMSRYAASHISDEVGTVGNAVCWMYLMDRLTGGEALKPKERWVWDLAEEHVGITPDAGSVRLPRNLTT